MRARDIDVAPPPILYLYFIAYLCWLAAKWPYFVAMTYDDATRRRCIIDYGTNYGEGACSPSPASHFWLMMRAEWHEALLAARLLGAATPQMSRANVIAD